MNLYDYGSLKRDLQKGDPILCSFLLDGMRELQKLYKDWVSSETYNRNTGDQEKNKAWDTYYDQAIITAETMRGIESITKSLKPEDISVHLISSIIRNMSENEIDLPL